MQRKLARQLRSDEELVKDAGLILDFDEITRKGSMTREEVSIAKWYGIYRSRQAGSHMARVVVPGGRLTSVEARDLARLSKQYSPNRISITTRQSAQFHCLQLETLPQFLRDIQAVGMTTFHGCGDVTRNVAACPWASTCKHRVFDVLPYAQEIATFLSDCRELDNLPRKFKVTLSGCAGDCGQPHINCVGLRAVLRQLPDGTAEPGFEVKIGGGLGWRPFIAQTLYTFVPREQAAQVCRALGMLFRDHGDRYLRMFARLKFVVHRNGIAECRRILEEILDAEGIDRSRFLDAPIESAAATVPLRPLREDAPEGTDGLALQRIKIPKGEIDSDALARIADLAEIYGDKYIYTTNRQNIEIHGVKPDRVAGLRQEIEALGFDTENFFGLTDVVTCVGTTYCPLAVTRTHGLFDALQEIVHDPKYVSIRDKALINISGCPNSCSQFHIADIGFRGLRVREDTGAVEGYRIVLGGEEFAFGRILADHMKFGDCLRIARVILDTFLTTKPSETLAQQVQREGMGRYQEAVAALGIDYSANMAVNPLEYSVFAGQGEATGDQKVIARDVPCQEACPAKTNVPEYIRLIAQGNPEAAHLINQEDNVFPGVLGRVCTRPCEDRCRYQWTSTRGAVRICHLKRAAADGKAGKSQPLPAWYAETGKKVAIVGAGPAGLAAARELKRYGHAVTIHDRAALPGGQIRAIPEFRLPAEIIEEDINAILDSGVELRCGEDVDAEGLAALRQDYDAVLVAAGTNKPYALELEGLPEDLRIEGLTFMKRYNAGDPVKVEADALVIGGGFTAVDCVRAARRLLGNQGNVAIMYRRGEAQMAATADELHEIRAESIRIETLVTPIAARVEKGKLQGVTFRRNLLGDVDESGKPAFIPIEGSEFEMPCNTLVFAIGQTQEREVLGGITFGQGQNTTSEADVFVAGDFASGSGDIIRSAADGKRAADAMDTFLMGEVRRKTFLHIRSAGLTGRSRDHDLIYPPQMPVLTLGERAGNGEVEQGFTDDQADAHAWRCYLCNHKFEIDQDKCIHCDWCIRVSPRDCILRLDSLQLDQDGQPAAWTEVPASEPEKATYIWINSDNCIRCGNCINICPVDAISLRKCDRKAVNCCEAK